MLNSELRRLNRTGWLLVVIALTATVLLSIPIGHWVLDSVERSTLRTYRTLIVCLLAIPGFVAAVVVFSVGKHLLERLGIHVHRMDPGGTSDLPRE